MKTNFLYGLGMAIAGLVIALLLNVLGFHANAEKLPTGQMIGMVLGIIVTIGGLILAIRARREDTPVHEEFGYGRALGAGTLTALVSSFFGSLFNVLYMTVINPGLQDIIVEGEIAKMEERGMTSAQIEQAEGMVRMMTGPVASGIMGFIMAFIVSFIICLIISAFLKRPAVDELPPAMAS
ncbi:DUF4199 domain-containing protein [Synoicihabitans lomoniglobus]|uniref:DUF4199 domain-containing protein n=1 Tax=Synoicihabitans lomoniglobus TaxID=2909285 RepID=A0AAF0A060_9BACT|nr:DUF4199 domain-containing protein [Opitutaceae bacterium LMO-M01]WED64012.1 DUF4199 domain-containing protein [Opitutaceae bacterium LMO-M01]